MSGIPAAPAKQLLRSSMDKDADSTTIDQTPKHLQDMNAAAGQNFDDDGYVSPVVLILSPTQNAVFPVQQLMGSGSDKSVLAGIVREIAAKMQATEVIMITEAWMYMAKGKADHTSKQLVMGEIRVSELRPEDKQEVVMVQYESQDATYMVLNRITRPEDGRPLLEPPDVSRQDRKDYKGRMTGLLPRDPH